MKIRKLKSKQIISLYLLKSKTYDSVISKKNISNSLVKSHLTEILASFKKSLHIIFQYHKKNKLILFIGLPENLRTKINKSTHHVALSKFVNLKGSNFSVSKNENFLKDNKKPYLIILIDHVNMDEVIKESYLAKIPLICINTVSNKYSFAHVNYKVSLNHNPFQSLHSLFFVGLNFLFK